MEVQHLITQKKNRTERRWTQFFGWMGLVMFVAGTFESLVTLFWIGKQVVHMDGFRVGFATVGFVFALANKQLGVFANNLGALLINKFK